MNPTVTIKGTEYELQPLTVAQMRAGGMALAVEIDRLNAAINAGNGNRTETFFSLMEKTSQFVLMSLQPVYPAVTVELIETLTWRELVGALGGVIGLTESYQQSGIAASGQWVN
jgi:hypothetical protein